MEFEGIGGVRALDAEDKAEQKTEPAAQPAPGKEAKPADRAAVHYTSAAERCQTCSHFEDEQMKCKLHSFDAEPDGHCDTWSPFSEGAEDEQPGEEDMAAVNALDGDEDDAA